MRNEVPYTDATSLSYYIETSKTIGRRSFLCGFEDGSEIGKDYAGLQTPRESRNEARVIRTSMP